MRREVRSLTKSDIPAVLELANKAGPYIRLRGGSDYWLYATLFSDTCLCACEDGEIAGFLCAFQGQSGAEEELYVQDLAVAPAHRNAGIGSALLKELLERAKRLCVSRVWLTSEPGNDAAMRLWAKFGFTNPEADYRVDGLWITADLKGRGADRAIFQRGI